MAERLEKLIEEERMTSFDKRTILELSYDVIVELTKNYQHLRKGMGDVMSGAMIETDARKILNQGLSQGLSQGKAESIIELLEDMGYVSEKLRDYIFKQKEPDELRRLLKLAASVESVEEFEREAGILVAD